MSTGQHGKFTTSSLKGGFARKTRFYLKDGSNPYRILPPFRSLAEKGIIAKYWEVYWLEGSDKKKRPVPSVLISKSNGKGKPKTILQRDPIADKLEALAKQVEAMEQAGGQDAIVAALKAKLQDLYLDKAYYVNAISPSGEIGVLKLRYTAFQNLKARLEELEKAGVDAINAGPGNGVVFDFQKTKDDKGKTVYPVDFAKRTYRENGSGRLMSEMQQLEIDESVLKRMETEAEDLSTVFRIITPEEVALLATFDPTMVDRVFARPDQVAEAGQDAPAEAEVETEMRAPVIQRTAAPVQAQSAPVAQQTQSAPVQAQYVAPAPTPAPAMQTPPPPSSANPGVQSIVDRFLTTGKV